MTEPELGRALRVTTTESDGVVVLEVVGEVDMATSPRLRAEVSRLLDTRPTVLVIDLRGVVFFGSTGISMLVEAEHHARRLGVPMGIAAAQPTVLRPLAATEVDALVTVRPDPATAAAAVLGDTRPEAS
ncbi:STAS domain-containing protein [Saccharothrix sp.]|uniref:STAS domain-containing protein n=1 Tax=Saccharothrix sp. TaxID=1873460 RepID=UPI0028113921|nr:STAS domain-containing protein [Saccharothrix sp.]